MAMAREFDLEACEADISCSPQQIDRISQNFKSKLQLKEASDSESDNTPFSSKICSKKNTSSTSETDSSYCGDRVISLPAKTSSWNISCLESLGIFYNESYHSSPLDILNIIFQEVKIFSPLNKDQKANVESMQNCLTFSTSVHDIIQHKANIVQNEHRDIYLPALENDIQNLSVPALHGVDDFVGFLVISFLRTVQVMISCQAAFIYRLRQTGVPKDMCVDILKMFSQMCDILPVPGSVKKCTMDIQATTVKSASDVALIPKKYRHRAFGVDTACIVSVFEVKGVKQSAIVKHHRHKVRKMRSATDCSDSESQSAIAKHHRRKVRKMRSATDSSNSESQSAIVKHHRRKVRKMRSATDSSDSESQSAIVKHHRRKVTKMRSATDSSDSECQSAIVKQHQHKVRKMRSATDSSDSESQSAIVKHYRHKVRKMRSATDSSDSESQSAIVKQHRHKVRKMRSGTDSSDNESHVSPKPAIYQKLCSNILGQHGGELLVHRNIYGSGLSIGRIWKYLPGMICVGTEVIFTLLKINSTHLHELEKKMAKTDAIKLNTRATIFYSEPKDMLKKEDRDILLEAFTRLSNIDITSD